MNPMVGKEKLNGSRRLVLVMDDQALIRRNLVRLLDVMGYDSLEAANGTEAIEQICGGAVESRVELALLDLSIEDGLGGIETIRYLRKNSPELPIVVSTGSADERQFEILRDMGVVDFLLKPFSFTELKTLLSSVFPDRKQGEDLPERKTVSVSEKSSPSVFENQIPENDSYFLFAVDLFPFAISIFDTHSFDAIFVNRKAEEEAGDDLNLLLRRIGIDLKKNVDGKGSNQFASQISLEGRRFGYTVYPWSAGFFFVLFRNITELEQIRTIDRNRNKYCDYNQLLSQIIHEIGNPLAGIMGILQVTQLNLSRYNQDELLTHLDNALDEVRRLSRILKALRPFASDSSESPEKINLRNWIAFAIREMPHGEWRNGIEIELPATLEVFARKEDLRFVVTQILENARLASPENLRIRIFLGKQTSSYVEVLFEDNGPGIPPEMRDRVFSPFVSSFDGKMGLGLPLSRKKMVNMGGMIEVSACDSGARISLLVPLEDSAR